MRDLKFQIPTLFIFYVLIYTFLEVTFRAVTYQLPDYPYFALYGSTSLWMGFNGGIIGLFILLVARTLQVLDIKIKCLLVTAFIYAVELASGYVLNIRWGFSIWDYRDLPLNYLGQITLVFLPIWYAISVLGFWIYDFIRWCIFDEIQNLDNPLVYYRQAFWR